MSITLDLSPQDEARLVAAAEAEGVDRAAVLRRLVRTHLPQPKIPLEAVPNERNQRAIALLRKWREEDATDDEEELERRDIENAELMRNLEAH